MIYFFLCMLSGHATASCLGFCFLASLPLGVALFVSTLFRASLIVPSTEVELAHEQHGWSHPASDRASIAESSGEIFEAW